MDRYKIIISSKAHQDILNIVSFVLNVSEEAALELTDDIYSSIETLSRLPERNPLFEMPNIAIKTRKLILNKRYIVIYVIDEDKVIIYRVLDSRRSFYNLL